MYNTITIKYCTRYMGCMLQLNTVVWPLKYLWVYACCYWYCCEICWGFLYAKNPRPAVRFFFSSQQNIWWHLPKAHFLHTWMVCFKGKQDTGLWGCELEAWVYDFLKYFGPNIDTWTYTVIIDLWDFELWIFLFSIAAFQSHLLWQSSVTSLTASVKIYWLPVAPFTQRTTSKTSTSWKSVRSLYLSLIFFPPRASASFSKTFSQSQSCQVAFSKWGMIVVHHFLHFHQNIVGPVMSDLQRGAMTENFGQPVTKALCDSLLIDP